MHVFSWIKMLCVFWLEYSLQCGIYSYFLLLPIISHHLKLGLPICGM